LSLSVPLLSDEKLAAIEREGSAFERLERFKLEAFEDRFMKKMKDSVRTRVRLLKLRRKLEETFVPPSVDSKKTSSSGKKSGKKKQSTKAKAVKSEDASLRVEAEAEEEEVEIFEKFAGLPEAEALASLWKQISRKQIPKLSRALHQSRSARLFNCKKIAQATAGLVKRQNSRLAGKPVLAARRSMKEMLGFWKRNEREERELRKRAEKEAIERRRIEEEQREARRQAKKLNFLITQTELYSHFVGRRKQTTESSIDTANAALSKDTDFADVEDSVIQAEAERIAKNAAAAHHAKMEQFDQHRGEKEEDEDDMNFMNPSTLKDAVILEQPALMQVSLKSYQLKGLTWLASLYEQVIQNCLNFELFNTIYLYLSLSISLLTLTLFF
jgi:SNF2 family DNA or RNA helicase